MMLINCKYYLKNIYIIYCKDSSSLETMSYLQRILWKLVLLIDSLKILVCNQNSSNLSDNDKSKR